MWQRLIGRRSAWAVVGVWVAAYAAAIAFGVPGRYADAQQNSTTAFLPADADSTRLLEKTAGADDTSSVVIAYHRPRAMTQQDLKRIVADQHALGPSFDKVEFSPPYGTAMLIGSVPGGQESEAVPPAVKKIRSQVDDRDGGLTVKVTGEAGFATDAEAVFDTINATVLFAAVGWSWCCSC